MKYKPKNKADLSQLLGKLIKERGNRGNFNDIDTSSIADMSRLFQNSDFNGDISKWDVSRVTNMHCMFYGATSFNQDLSSWDVSNVKYMHRMFCEVTSFNSDLIKQSCLKEHIRHICHI
jgi:surface protein